MHSKKRLSRLLDKTLATGILEYYKTGGPAGLFVPPAFFYFIILKIFSEYHPG